MGSVVEERDNDADDGKLSRDEVFEVLSNRRRRFTLHYLQQNGDGAELGDVADQVAAWENGKSVREVASDERKTVYTSLQQFHLDKMEEKGVVEFDQRAGRIGLTEEADRLDIYLEVVEQYDIPWSYYYLGITVLGAILVTLSWANVPPFGGIPYSGWIVFLLGTLIVSAVSHLCLSRKMHLGHGDVPPEVRQ